MSKPIVSVVVPVYNAEAYLDRCVSSITGQSYSELQIILVNDGSTDRSAALCDAWAEKDRRIKVIHKENAGAGMARNSGIDAADGDYILFVDSDDYIHCSTVEKCVLRAQQTHAEAVLFGRCTVSPTGAVTKKTIRTNSYFFEGAAVCEQVLSGLFFYEKGIGISSCDKLIKLSVIKDAGLRFFSERELISEDAYFMLELFARLNAVSILPENLYYYFENEHSFSRTYDPNRQILNDQFLEKGIAACKTLGHPPRVEAGFKARYQIYALAGMKQIIASSLPRKEKQNAFKAVFKNPLLLESLTSEVIALANRPSRLFWRLFQLRCYPLCYLLLWYKARK